MKKNNNLLKPLPWLALLAFIVMVGVNAMANALPINGRTTGDISNSYENLFAPAGITFSIWGLIYLFLLVYTAYQFKYYKAHGQVKQGVIDKVNKVYIATSLINSLWIFAWHYDFIFISLLLMMGLLVSLIRINDWLRVVSFKGIEAFAVKVPFAIYLGWISVATIANITVWLVSIGWNGFGVEDYIWTCAVIIVGTIIGVAVMGKYKSIPYGLVFIWAYGGILLKHLSPSGYNGQYLSIITVVGFCLVVLIGRVLMLIRNIRSIS